MILKERFKCSGLNSLTINELLQPLPHKMQVRFALHCANDVKQYMKDERSIKALHITQLWLEDKATSKEITDAYYAASAAHNAGAYAAYAAYAYNPVPNAYYAAPYAAHAAANAAANAAAHAAASASSAAYAHNTAAYAANAAYYTGIYASGAAHNANDTSSKDYKPILIKMIKELSEIEQILFLG